MCLDLKPRLEIQQFAIYMHVFLVIHYKTQSPLLSTKQEQNIFVIPPIHSNSIHNSESETHFCIFFVNKKSTRSTEISISFRTQHHSVPCPLIYNSHPTPNSFYENITLVCYFLQKYPPHSFSKNEGNSIQRE